jgi:beta-glucosidase
MEQPFNQFYGTALQNAVVHGHIAKSVVDGMCARQLKGFQRVTLSPGQSRTVTFHLNKHDLAYWKTPAGKWVVPEGQFQVYVGDSSALANLPLHGGFTLHLPQGHG